MNELTELPAPPLPPAMLLLDLGQLQCIRAKAHTLRNEAQVVANAVYTGVITEPALLAAQEACLEAAREALNLHAALKELRPRV